MPEEPVGVGNDGIARPVENHVGPTVFGIVEALGGKLGAVGDEIGAEDGVHGLQARRIAAVSRKHARRIVGGLESGECERGRLPGGVASRADAGDDGLRAVFLGNFAGLLGDDSVRLVHRDLFPHVLAALPHAPERMEDAVGMIDRLDHGQAAHAQPALVHR